MVQREIDREKIRRKGERAMPRSWAASHPTKFSFQKNMKVKENMRPIAGKKSQNTRIENRSWGQDLLQGNIGDNNPVALIFSGWPHRSYLESTWSAIGQASVLQCLSGRCGACLFPFPGRWKFCDRAYCGVAGRKPRRLGINNPVPILRPTKSAAHVWRFRGWSNRHRAGCKK